MKNQFVADVNDYFKYGLLRALSDCEDLRPIGIWWMLTNDDAGNHGNNVAFLDEPNRFEACDIDLFGKLQKIQTDPERNVLAVAKRNLIPKAKYWPSANSRNCDASEMAKASHAKLADPYATEDFRGGARRFVKQFGEFPKQIPPDEAACE